MPIDSSDEDVINETPQKIKKTEKTLHKKKAVKVIDSDSDNEKKSPKKLKTPKKPEVREKSLKQASAADVFGSEPVKQTVVPKTPIIKNEKTSPKEASQAKVKLETELGIHDDLEFERTLLELDEDMLVDNYEQSVNDSFYSNGGSQANRKG